MRFWEGLRIGTCFELDPDPGLLVNFEFEIPFELVSASVGFVVMVSAEDAIESCCSVRISSSDLGASTISETAMSVSPNFRR
jgi:hypothetical protein